MLQLVSVYAAPLPLDGDLLGNHETALYTVILKVPRRCLQAN